MDRFNSTDHQHRAPPVLLPPYGYSHPRMLHDLSSLPLSKLPNPRGTNPSTFPNMPPPLRPPHIFPLPQEPRTNLWPRNPDQNQKLAVLDRERALKFLDDDDQGGYDDNGDDGARMEGNGAGVIEGLNMCVLNQRQIARDFAILEAHHLKDSLRDDVVGPVGNHFPAPGSGYRESEVGAQGEFLKREKIYTALAGHHHDRVGYLHLASERLQAATGFRNDLRFELPNPNQPRLPRAFITFPSHKSTSHQSRSSNFGPSLSKTSLSIKCPANYPVLPPQHTLPMFSSLPYIDPSTGVGLYNYLLTMGNRYGIQSRKLTSISLHDFTPDPLTGAFANKLLAHYTAQNLGERIAVYESAVPATFMNQRTGRAKPQLETWLWFLIQRPLVSFNMDAETGDVNSERVEEIKDSDEENEENEEPFCTPHSRGGIDADVEANPAQDGSQAQSESRNIKSTNEGIGSMPTPPNFPRPVPLSFVVFAVPLSNATKHPPLIENLASSNSAPRIPDPTTPDPNSRSRHTFPWAREHKDNKQKTMRRDRIVYKRKDYDLSFQGTPIFEFSRKPDLESHPDDNTNSSQSTDSPNTTESTGHVPLPHLPQTYLSTEALPPFHPSDPHLPYSPHTFQNLAQSHHSHYAAASSHDSQSLNFHGRAREIRNMNEEGPCPYQGQWWSRFWTGVYEDVERWRCVKRACGRGALRVVGRWVDFDVEGDDVRDGDWVNGEGGGDEVETDVEEEDGGGVGVGSSCG